LLFFTYPPLLMLRGQPYLDSNLAEQLAIGFPA
jgi:hypothetical protein